MDEYTTDRLYSDAFRIKCNWENYLPNEIFTFHDLLKKEINSPVALQMGVMLPFVSSLCGPTTRSLFLTKPSVINLFWLNVAASGVGKSQSRSVLVTDSLEYISQHTENEFQNFSVSRYTRAGIEDKLIGTKGYCCMVTDEGTIFFEDICRKQVKHETDLSLLNQLYDGKGDKTTLAQNRERVVPSNSTSLSISIQQEAFVSSLDKLGKQFWLDNGFGERFLMSTLQPYRFKYRECKESSKLLRATYDENLVSKVCLSIYDYHYDSNICYELDDEAEELYEQIFDRYNEQFNLKYAVSDEDDPMSSQPKLDFAERCEIAVRTKAAELIGRLATVLWIYCNAFQCVLKARPFVIPKKITRDYVVRAEEIVNISYSQSETFSSAVLTSKGTGTTTPICRPKLTDRSKVVHSIIKSQGPIVNIRNMTKNIRNMTTPLVKAELEKLCAEGFGIIVSREDMIKDKVLPTNQCCSVFIKPYIMNLDNKFFDMCSDKDINRELYETNFEKPVDATIKRIVLKYHPHKDMILISQETQISGGTVNEEVKSRKAKYGYNSKHVHTALDDIADDTDSSSRTLGDMSGEASTSRQDNITSQPFRHLERTSAKEDKGIQTDTDTETDKEIVAENVRVNKPVVYKKSSVGNKLNPIKAANRNSDVEEEDNNNAVTTERNNKSKVNYCSSEDSESTQVPNLASSQYLKQSSRIDVDRKKTIRWNRPKKSDLPVDSQPLRQSKRIRDMKEKEWKEKNNDSSSTDNSSSTQMTSHKKRRLSKSQRDDMVKKRQKKI